jgi:hypothetical protein
VGVRQLAVAVKWRLSGGGGGSEGGGKGNLSAVARVVELRWIGGSAVVEWRWWSSGGGR